MASGTKKQGSGAGANNKAVDTLRKALGVGKGQVIRFFLAVGNDEKEARAMMKTGVMQAGAYLSGDHVTFIRAGETGDITRLGVEGGIKEKFVPLPWQETVKLFEMHGYKFAGPAQYQKVLALKRGKN